MLNGRRPGFCVVKLDQRGASLSRIRCSKYSRTWLDTELLGRLLKVLSEPFNRSKVRSYRARGQVA